MEPTQDEIDRVHAHDATTAVCQATTLSTHGNYLVKCAQPMAHHDPRRHHGRDDLTGEQRDWEV